MEDSFLDTFLGHPAEGTFLAWLSDGGLWALLIAVGAVIGWWIVRLVLRRGLRQAIRGLDQHEATADVVEQDFTVNIDEFETDSSPIDYTSFDVPDDAENYDPLHISGYELPDMEIDPNEFEEFIDDLPLNNDENGE